MDFIYEGFNGYDNYVYLYNPPRHKLERAVAVIMLKMKNQELTEFNIEQQIKIVQEQDIIDATDFVEENYEEIKMILKKNANLDF